MPLIKKKVLFLFVSLFVVTSLMMKGINSNLMIPIMDYGEIQSKNLIKRIINNVIDESIKNDIKQEIVLYNEDDIISLDFNTSILNSVAANVTKKLQKYLYELENGIMEEEFMSKVGLSPFENQTDSGIILKIPIGRATNIGLLSYLGFYIPVRYRIMGEVSSVVASSIKEYGINNALVEVVIRVKASFIIYIPTLSKEENISVDVPIVMKVIQGDIPESFYGSRIIGGG